MMLVRVHTCQNYADLNGNFQNGTSQNGIQKNDTKRKDTCQNGNSRVMLVRIALLKEWHSL